MEIISLFIMNQGWRLGIVIFFIALIRTVMQQIAWKGAAYLLWYIIPICYFYITVAEFINMKLFKTSIDANNAPLVLLSQNENRILLIIWIIGCIGMLFYLCYSHLKVRHYTKNSVHLKDNIFITKNIHVPFTVGFLHPQIFLPTDMREDFFEPVIRHEQVHVARKDYLIKNCAFVFLALNWFQPLMWLAYYLFVKDMELTCDELALRNSPYKFQKQYASALVELSAKETCVQTITAEYGNLALKERIWNICHKANRRPIQYFLIKMTCIVIIIISIPASLHIHKLFGAALHIEVVTIYTLATGSIIHP